MHTQNITPIRPAPRTPYHSLGEDAKMRIPEWAQHRSVYRSAGRTLYVVETDTLADARRDLARLDSAGWNVAVQSEGASARIALSRAA
ncbi:hypothetical protein FB468_2681 [Leucobacter komagatae]|uniref:Uncharacterized protein n=1 Tax=Leucobacter komagatae TaxID=55969 RepID=A0A542Y953_9MICO|nr:hypothetical protein [Leucobacter komagatae]TQL44620.1 hypothetical protein FB468_2681 [Leucobacter komagatae]